MGFGWEADKEQTDPFMPQIMSILGRKLFSIASIEDDQKRATDLIIDASRVSVRVRDERYLLNETYRNQFTLRYSRPSGAMSEYQKFVKGRVDYFFYGFGNYKTIKLIEYTVIDLKELRAQMIAALDEASLRPQFSLESNHDGSSQFIAVDIRSLTPECILHRYQGLRAA